jgi:hypothetical protein
MFIPFRNNPNQPRARVVRATIPWLNDGILLSAVWILSSSCPELVGAIGTFQDVFHQYGIVAFQMQGQFGIRHNSTKSWAFCKLRGKPSNKTRYPFLLPLPWIECRILPFP